MQSGNGKVLAGKREAQTQIIHTIADNNAWNTLTYSEWLQKGHLSALESVVEVLALHYAARSGSRDYRICTLIYSTVVLGEFTTGRAVLSISKSMQETRNNTLNVLVHVAYAHKPSDGTSSSN